MDYLLSNAEADFVHVVVREACKAPGRNTYVVWRVRRLRGASCKQLSVVKPQGTWKTVVDVGVVALDQHRQVFGCNGHKLCNPMSRGMRLADLAPYTVYSAHNGDCKTGQPQQVFTMPYMQTEPV